MEHSWPEVAVSTVESLAVRIVSVHMVTDGRMDLVGWEGTAKRCEDRHLSEGRSPGYYFAQESAFLRALLSDLWELWDFIVNTRSCRLLEDQGKSAW